MPLAKAQIVNYLDLFDPGVNYSFAARDAFLPIRRAKGAAAAWAEATAPGDGDGFLRRCPGSFSLGIVGARMTTCSPRTTFVNAQ